MGVANSVFNTNQVSRNSMTVKKKSDSNQNSRRDKFQKICQVKHGSETDREREKFNLMNLSRKIPIFVNGLEYLVPKDRCIVDGINEKLPEDEKIPTFCYHQFLPASKLYRGKCGLCDVVDLETGKRLRACRDKPIENMEIITNSNATKKNIITVLKRKLAKHPLKCDTCEVNGHCQFQDLLKKYGVTVDSLNDEQKATYYRLFNFGKKKIVQNDTVLYDPSICLHCNSCVRACENITGSNVLKIICSEKNLDTNLDTLTKKEKVIFRDLEDYNEKMFQSDCISCGQCSFVCPTGAIQEVSHYDKVTKLLEEQEKNKLEDNSRIIVVQLAPACRVTIGESFGFKPGRISEKQIVTILRLLGFAYIFDTTIGADITIVEEANEFLHRLENNGKFPMLTSCCPSFVNLVEKHFPEFIENLSTVRSPHMIMGKIIKGYWAKKKGIDRKRIICVSIMPCTAKKDEVIRFKKKDCTEIDVDYVITTRELVKMIKAKGLKDLESIEFSNFDDIDDSSSNGIQFGGSGGVASSGIQNLFAIAGEELPNDLLDNLHNSSKKGTLNEHAKRCKMAKASFKGQTIKVEVVQTGRLLRKTLKKYSKIKKEGNESLENCKAWIEGMACPGGCILGGGQPKIRQNGNNGSILNERLSALRRIGDNRQTVVSCEHPFVKEVYAKYLGEPLGKRAHELIHTKFSDHSIDVFEDSLGIGERGLFYSNEDYDEDDNNGGVRIHS